VTFTANTPKLVQFVSDSDLSPNYVNNGRLVNYLLIKFTKDPDAMLDFPSWSGSLESVIDSKQVKLWINPGSPAETRPLFLAPEEGQTLEAVNQAARDFRAQLTALNLDDAVVRRFDHAFELAMSGADLNVTSTGMLTITFRDQNGTQGPTATEHVTIA
jgi:hypothetical protein